jgi:hypothetical protein
VPTHVMSYTLADVAPSLHRGLRRRVVLLIFVSGLVDLLWSMILPLVDDQDIEVCVHTVATHCQTAMAVRRAALAQTCLFLFKSILTSSKQAHAVGLFRGAVLVRQKQNKVSRAGESVPVVKTGATSTNSKLSRLSPMGLDRRNGVAGPGTPRKSHSRRPHGLRTTTRKTCKVWCRLSRKKPSLYFPQLHLVSMGLAPKPMMLMLHLPEQTGSCLYP